MVQIVRKKEFGGDFLYIASLPVFVTLDTTCNSYDSYIHTVRHGTLYDPTTADAGHGSVQTKTAVSMLFHHISCI